MKFCICIIEKQNSKSVVFCHSAPVSHFSNFPLLHLITAQVSPSNQSHLYPIHLQSAIVFRSQIHTCPLPDCPLYFVRLSGGFFSCLAVACLCRLTLRHPTSWLCPATIICLSFLWYSSLIKTVKFEIVWCLGVRFGVKWTASSGEDKRQTGCLTGVLRDVCQPGPAWLQLLFLCAEIPLLPHSPTVIPFNYFRICFLSTMKNICRLWRTRLGVWTALYIAFGWCCQTRTIVTKRQYTESECGKGCTQKGKSRTEQLKLTIHNNVKEILFWLGSF